MVLKRKIQEICREFHFRKKRYLKTHSRRSLNILLLFGALIFMLLIGSLLLAADVIFHSFLGINNSPDISVLKTEKRSKPIPWTGTNKLFDLSF
jgi:hypothetical protein